MAAGRPIVSTAVADVVRNFTPIVKVARSRDGFVRRCARRSPAPEPELVARGIGMAKDASWESIVGKMRATSPRRWRARARLVADAPARRAPWPRGCPPRPRDVAGEELTA
jgi:hypothetical protein